MNQAGRVADFPARDEGVIDSADGGQQLARARGDDQRNVRARIFFPDSRDRWRRQDEIADALELNEEDVHVARMTYRVA